MAIITISRAYGCGGEYVGERIANRLGYKLISKELVEYAAILSGTSKERASTYDEEQHSSIKAFFSKFIDVDMFTDLLTPYKSEKTPELVLPKNPESIFDRNEYQGLVFEAETFQKTMERVMKKLADEDNVVLIGRGGQCLLANHPKAIHFRLVAPLSHRAEWHRNRENLSMDEARRQVLEIDSRKARFIKDYYNMNIDDATIYHAVVNMTKYSLDEVAEALVALWSVKTGVPVPPKKE